MSISSNLNLCVMAVVSITIIQIATTRTSSVMHAMANHYVMIDGADCIYGPALVS